jgi:hypothetical protein
MAKPSHRLRVVVVRGEEVDPRPRELSVHDLPAHRLHSHRHSVIAMPNHRRDASEAARRVKAQSRFAIRREE